MDSIAEKHAVHSSITKLMHRLISHGCDNGVNETTARRNGLRINRRKSRAHEILLGEDVAAKQVSSLSSKIRPCEKVVGSLLSIYLQAIDDAGVEED